jgi:hypothetical protein
VVTFSSISVCHATLLFKCTLHKATESVFLPVLKYIKKYTFLHNAAFGACISFLLECKDCDCDVFKTVLSVSVGG